MTTTCSSRRSLSPAQQARLAKVFEHAQKTAVAPKDFNYVVELFAQCVLGDPGNVEYMRAYIEILQRKYDNNKKGCPLAALKERGARHAVKKSLAEGHWDEVIRQGVKVLAVNPWDVSALTAMAAAAKGSGDLRCELAYLKAAVMADPKNPLCNRLFAIAMTERGQIDQAIVFWHRVEEVLRGNEEAQRAIRALTMRKANSRGDFDGLEDDDPLASKRRFEARQQEELSRKEQLRQSIQTEPTNVAHYLELARIMVEEGHFEEAEDVLCQAYEVSGEDPEVRDRWDDAQLRGLRKKITSADGEDKKILQREFANKELEVCRRRVERVPDNARYRFDLGYRYMLSGQYETAVGELQRAQKDQRLRGVTLLALGQCFQHVKQHRLARSHYESAIEELPERDAENRKLALYLAGRLALAMHDLDTAEKHLSALVMLDISFRDGEALLNRLTASRSEGRPCDVGTA